VHAPERTTGLKVKSAHQDREKSLLNQTAMFDAFEAWISVARTGRYY
jgi:hypothetical protein